MNKFMKLCLCGIASAALITGCSNSAAKTEPTEAAETTGTAVAAEGSITLGDYKGLEVTVAPVEVTDEEIQQSIDQMLTFNPNSEEVTGRAVQDGDIVNIDFVGTKDGVAFDGGSATGSDLKIGSNSMIEGFEEGLVGANIGDKVKLDLTFPEDYSKSAELAGQAVVFNVTVNGISIETPAVFDDAFVQRFSQSEYNNTADFKDYIKETLTTEKQTQADQQKLYDLLDAAVANSTITCAEADLAVMEEDMRNQYTMLAQYYFGMDMESYVANMGMTMDEFNANLKTASESAVKQQMLVSAIAEKEGLTVTEEEMAAYATENGFESLDAFKEQYSEDNIKTDLIYNKVVPILEENAVIK